MKIYYARFPFEVNLETGDSGFYAPKLRALRYEVRDQVAAAVENDPSSLRYYTEPLDKPRGGLVHVEITVEIEEVTTVKVTRELFCTILNGGGGFVVARKTLAPERRRFRVPAELFEDR